MKESALEVRNLSYRIGSEQILDKVSFSLSPGDFAVFFGPNGAGKTTLFSLLSGLYHPETGTIAVYGTNTLKDPVKALSTMGMVFQERTLDADLTVRQNFSYYLSLQGTRVKDLEDKIVTELERVNLEGLLEKKVRSLSGGQMRKLEIARAMVLQPRILLLDEATVGLDFISRREIVDYVHDLAAKKQVTVLWATHLVDEIYPDDLVHYLEKGRILKKEKGSFFAKDYLSGACL